MSLTLKERFLMHPGTWGACCGVCVLVLGQFMEVLILSATMGGAGRMPSLDFTLWFIFGLELIPPIFWGWILGGSVGRAWHHWVHNRHESARHTLRRTGGWCTLINGVWTLLPLLAFLSGLDWQILPFLGLRLLTNLCLQASALVLLASFILPRREEDRVQVTENLRL